MARLNSFEVDVERLRVSTLLREKWSGDAPFPTHAHSAQRTGTNCSHALKSQRSKSRNTEMRLGLGIAHPITAAAHTLAGNYHLPILTTTVIIRNILPTTQRQQSTAAYQE